MKEVKLIMEVLKNILIHLPKIMEYCQMILVTILKIGPKYFSNTVMGLDTRDSKRRLYLTKILSFIFVGIKLL